MLNIFIGFIFIFVDFNITFGNSQIDIMPNFLGYIILARGLVEMAEESPRFMEAKPYATGMAVYMGVLFCINLLGLSSQLGVLSYVLSLISIIASLYISYKIIMGVIDMEEKYNTNLNGSRLKSTWTALAVLDILSYLMVLIPTIGVVIIIAGVIVIISFLVTFNRSQKLYYAMIEEEKQTEEETQTE